ncbi:MAG: hypothetical protein K0U64_00590 [Actinomycetia bacterium]|nr:hypothetical protein [Actinomycetes bacterium]
MVATAPEEALADRAAAEAHQVFIALRSATSAKDVAALARPPVRLRLAIKNELSSLTSDNQTRERLDAFWQIFDEFDLWHRGEQDWEAGRQRIAAALRALGTQEPIAGSLNSEFMVAQAHLDRVLSNAHAYGGRTHGMSHKSNLPVGRFTLGRQSLDFGPLLA